MKQKENLERLLFVSQLKEQGATGRTDIPGNPAAASVRAIGASGFPAEAFRSAGIVGFTVYVGGGFCVFEFGFEKADGGFEKVFERLRQDRAVLDYLDRYEPYVDPLPLIDPGATASRPLAADVFLWRAESGVVSREPAERREGARPAARRPGGAARG